MYLYVCVYARFLSYIHACQVHFGPEQAEQHVERLARAFWLRVWSRDQDILSEASWRDAMADAGITDHGMQSRIIGLTSTPEVKKQLASNTERAIQSRAFGFPFTVFYRGDDVDGTTSEKPAMSLFGSDRFEMAAHALGLPWLGPQPNRPRAKL
jgi:glutathione S-transferase kappa 1